MATPPVMDYGDPLLGMFVDRLKAYQRVTNVMRPIVAVSLFLAILAPTAELAVPLLVVMVLAACVWTLMTLKSAETTIHYMLRLIMITQRQLKEKADGA